MNNVYKLQDEFLAQQQVEENTPNTSIVDNPPTSAEPVVIIDDSENSLPITITKATIDEQPKIPSKVTVDENDEKIDNKPGN
jgi:hypothetical protein